MAEWFFLIIIQFGDVHANLSMAGYEVLMEKNWEEAGHAREMPIVDYTAHQLSHSPFCSI